MWLRSPGCSGNSGHEHRVPGGVPQIQAQGEEVGQEHQRQDALDAQRRKDDGPQRFTTLHRLLPGANYEIGRASCRERV